MVSRKSNPSTSKDSTAPIGFEADFGPEHADTFRNVQHPDLRADYVLANPPFNDSDTALRGSAFLQSEASLQVVSAEMDNGRIYDPTCGTGGMFASYRRPCGMRFVRRRFASARSSVVQSARFVENHHGNARHNEHIQKSIGARETCRADSQALWTVHKRELSSESQSD